MTVPASVMIETILPQPLTKKVLTKCLNQSSDLITLFAIRILILAIQKFKSVVNAFRPQSRSHEPTEALREKVAAELTDEFCGRCPDMRHVIAVFRGCQKDKPILREATTCVLALYYETMPQVALEEKLDISQALFTVLPSTKLATLQNTEHPIVKLELRHLLKIASYSPDIRWWHKPGMNCYSADLAVSG